MTPGEIKLHRLAGHHLLTPSNPQVVVMDLCDAQAQFLSHVLHYASAATREQLPFHRGMRDKAFSSFNACAYLLEHILLLTTYARWSYE